MKMTKLATLFLTASLTLASGSVLAAETGSTDNNGDANAAAAAGQVAPDAKQNIAPNNVDNSQINTGNTNTGGTMLHPDSNGSGTMNHDTMSTDEMHKNTMCKDGKCPNSNDKVGDDANTKTDGTTQ
ncbi:YbgS-like family protein [Enterobacter ludwigii]|uniref:YbgS-like family protein n=1 Tax=Enterobacter ludwigii TaxID=299767 RepID=UPI00277C4BA2|nr:YbgS-like family protein [Enterobacter ludwigii]ELV2795363.1 YbgS-like family protein [Enterobacter ludwigii]HDS6668451.1 YbgS-like family protein [Enterobacter ludwigii]